MCLIINKQSCISVLIFAKKKRNRKKKNKFISRVWRHLYPHLTNLRKRMSPVCFQSFPFSPVAKIKHHSKGRYIVHHQHLPYAYLPPTRQGVIYLFKVRTSLDVMEHLEEAYECKNCMKTVIYLQMTVRSIAVRSITASVLSFTSECFWIKCEESWNASKEVTAGARFWLL